MINILIGILLGASGLAGWQIYRDKKAGKGWLDAARAVISGGGGGGPNEPH